MTGTSPRLVNSPWDQLQVVILCFIPSKACRRSKKALVLADNQFNTSSLKRGRMDMCSLMFTNSRFSCISCMAEIYQLFKCALWRALGTTAWHHTELQHSKAMQCIQRGINDLPYLVPGWSWRRYKDLHFHQVHPQLWLRSLNFHWLGELR